MTICPSCGAQNDDRDRFCGACGAFLETEIPGETDEVTLGPAVAPATPTDDAPTDVISGAADGAHQPEAAGPGQASVTCTRCGAPNDPGRTFCQRCGERLGAAVPTPGPGPGAAGVRVPAGADRHVTRQVSGRRVDPLGAMGRGAAAGTIVAVLVALVAGAVLVGQLFRGEATDRSSPTPGASIAAVLPTATPTASPSTAAPSTGPSISPPPSPATSPSPTAPGPSPDAVAPADAEEAASRFADAWFRGDREAALLVGTQEAVDELFATPAPASAPVLETCFQSGSEQWDCNVDADPNLLIVRVAASGDTFRVEDVALQ